MARWLQGAATAARSGQLGQGWRDGSARRWETGGISEQVAKSGLEVGTDSCSGLSKIFYFSARFWTVLNDLILLV